MLNLSSDLTAAYCMITKSLIRNPTYQPKDLDEFISITRKMMDKFTAMNIDPASISSSNRFRFNKKIIDNHNSQLNDFNKAYREQAAVITNFITACDKNKNFLNNYIKYIYAYIYEYCDKKKKKIMNKHPYLSSPVFSAMFCMPIFLISDDTISANHYYHAVNPTTNQTVNLFRINIIAGKTTTVKNTDIYVNSLLDITFDDMVSTMEQCAIMSVIEKLTKEHGVSFQENESEYVFNYAINVEFSLSLYLPKAYFRLKR